MKRRILALSLCMALATPVTSLAYVKSPGNPSEVGKTQAELNGYSEETWAKLMDTQTALFSDIPSLWPIKGGIGHITMAFGQNRHPFTGQWYIHTGIDLATGRSGDPIMATADGQVINVETDPGWGNYILIKHKHGFFTRYAHLSSFRVTRGQHVQKGQVIGYVGKETRNNVRRHKVHLR